MATSLSSVDGLISGMSTTQVISQLMTIEAQPQDRLVAQRNTLTTMVQSYQSVNTKFLAFQSASDKLTHADNWAVRTASSSSASVSATAASGALTGSITFDVQTIAKAQSYVSAGTFSSTSAIATAATQVTITKGTGTPVNVSVGDGSLASVVSGINAANVGVRAAAVQVGPGSFRLQLTSTTTGVDSNFTIVNGVDTAPLGTLNEAVHGQNATLLVGDPATAGQYTVASSSNTFAGVLPGVTLTVKAPATGVVVDVTPAVGQLATDVQTMVTAANNLLAEIKTQTAYDQATKTGQPLLGDSTMRSLQQQVLGMVSQTVGSNGSPAKAGVQVARDGTITFDAATFQTAYAADPVSTAALFLPGGTTTHPDPAQSALAGKISFLSASDQTARGSYDVKITVAATQARREVTGAVTPGEKLTFTVPGKAAVVVTAQPGDTLDTLVTRINDASATNALGLVARVESGVLQVRSATYGAAPTFTLTTDGALAVSSLFAGTDVAGTINGAYAKGSGQALLGEAADPVTHGLSFLITATPAEVATAAAQVGA
ncbi:MAG: flagellar hook-associated 2 domain protein, partial [Actinomycetia bacterium]|nr:flagellar hook-associated 2 domain protein [Actinomycetes bacterium]